MKRKDKKPKADKMKKFWEEESKEKAHKDIKGFLKKKAKSR